MRWTHDGIECRLMSLRQNDDGEASAEVLCFEEDESVIARYDMDLATTVIVRAENGAGLVYAHHVAAIVTGLTALQTAAKGLFS